MSDDLQSLLRKLPLETALVTDTEGAVLLRAGHIDDEPALQALALAFASSNDHASKLGIGKTNAIVSYYEKSTIVHSSCAPLILTLVLEQGGCVGLLLESVPQLMRALEPLVRAVERVQTNQLASSSSSLPLAL